MRVWVNRGNEIKNLGQCLKEEIKKKIDKAFRRKKHQDER